MRMQPAGCVPFVGGASKDHATINPRKGIGTRMKLHTMIGIVVLGISLGAVNGAQAQTLEQKIVTNAQTKLNKKIGDGQCTAFVSDVLKETGAQPMTKVTKQVVENGAVKKIESYSWGKHRVSLGKNAKPVMPQPGNIIQFESCVIKNANSSWNLGFPHHTSIVKSADGRKVTVLHQNMEGGDVSKSKVREDTIDLAGVVSGRYYIYAVVPQ